MVLSEEKDQPVGQSRPIVSPFENIRSHPLLGWALSQGLIEVSANGTWHLTERALQWLCHQPIKMGGPPDPIATARPCPDLYDA